MKHQGTNRQRLRALAYGAHELIEALQTMYPAKTPDLNTPERELWANIGARKVVELLQQLHDEAAGSDPMGRVLAPNPQ
jgi:hypothetical protein